MRLVSRSARRSKRSCRRDTRLGDGIAEDHLVAGVSQSVEVHYVGTAHRTGVQVQELTLRTPTLDDVFLSVTGARLREEQSQEETQDQVRAR
jgi:hypothetical protein